VVGRCAAYRRCHLSRGRRHSAEGRLRYSGQAPNSHQESTTDISRLTTRISKHAHTIVGNCSIRLNHAHHVGMNSTLVLQEPRPRRVDYMSAFVRMVAISS